VQTKKPEGARLDASNLGQIIGRLLYADAPAAPAVPQAEAPSTGPRCVVDRFARAPAAASSCSICSPSIPKA
jgi:hypothetical protein